MSVDQLGNTAESPVELLVKMGLVENQPVPSVNTLKNLLALSIRTDREYGVQVYEIHAGERESRGATYNKGERRFIYEPEQPADSTRGVFFHTHNGRRELSVWRLLRPGKLPWNMLPSDNGLGEPITGWSGDVAANLDRKLGGYLNIVSPYGVALHIGVTKKDPINQGLNDSQWEALVGKQSKRFYTVRELWQDRSSVLSSVMAWRQGWPRSSSNFFLLLAWDELYELTPVFTDLENLCFGNGVSSVMQQLKLDLPHQDNLSDVAQIW